MKTTKNILVSSLYDKNMTLLNITNKNYEQQNLSIQSLFKTSTLNLLEEIIANHQYFLQER